MKELLSYTQIAKERVHILKTWPEYYSDVESGKKSFEIRIDDRDYALGDILDIRGFDIKTNTFTGRQCFKRVTYILQGGQFGINAAYVVMGLTEIQPYKETDTSL